jgi:hypothetical protein
VETVSFTVKRKIHGCIRKRTMIIHAMAYNITDHSIPAEHGNVLQTNFKNRYKIFSSTLQAHSLWVINMSFI